jgi:hypothetical protein
MTFGAITGSGLATYVASMLSQAQEQATTTDSAAATARARASSSSALDAVAHSRKAVSAQAVLSKRQMQLTSDLQAALSKAGLAVKGELAFSVDADGEVQVTGTKDDQQRVAAFLKNDATKPGFTQRITDLVQSADKLSASMRDNAAWVQAARSVGRNGNMAALYSTFAQTQDTTAAAYRIDAKSGALSYPGVVASQA